MNTIAAVMTGKNIGAISTIHIAGPAANNLLKEIFTPTAKTHTAFTTGKTILGTISVNCNVIDQVLIGCKGQDNFAINCHGNPLIVSDILKILKDRKVQIVSAERLLAQIYSKQTEMNAIAIEAKLAISKVKTLDGTKIIANQVETGLTKTVEKWQQENISLEKIKNEAKKILHDSKNTGFLIYGCKIVLAGPANSGKSTIFNCLTGKTKTIVTDIKGTTRDWVSSNCQIGKLSAELYDTAGVDEIFSVNETIEKQAQEKAYQILEQADLVLLIIDASSRKTLLTRQLLEHIKDNLVLTVLNKCDLQIKFDQTTLPSFLKNIVKISAKNNTGIENLIEHIHKICRIEPLDLQQAVYFTSRQERLLKQIANSKSNENSLSSIAELLNGQLAV